MASDIKVVEGSYDGAIFDINYHPDKWWYIVVYEDKNCRICLQETLGVPPLHKHLHSIELFIGLDGTIDRYLPGQAHQRMKGVMEYSIKFPPPTKGDLIELFQEESG